MVCFDARLANKTNQWSGRLRKVESLRLGFVAGGITINRVDLGPQSDLL